MLAFHKHFGRNVASFEGFVSDGIPSIVNGNHDCSDENNTTNNRLGQHPSTTRAHVPPSAFENDSKGLCPCEDWRILLLGGRRGLGLQEGQSSMPSLLEKRLEHCHWSLVP